MTPVQDERYLPMQRQTGRQPAKAITDAGIMILLYGAGGVPGRGEIPMDLQPQASDDFPGVRGSGKNSTSDRSIEETDSFFCAAVDHKRFRSRKGERNQWTIVGWSRLQTRRVGLQKQPVQ